jgi:hypothetical protein
MRSCHSIVRSFSFSSSFFFLILFSGCYVPTLISPASSHLSFPSVCPFPTSLLALPFPALLTLAHSPISSRLLDVIVDSSSIPFKFTRKIIMRFDGHFFELVDHRVGSRVGEKLWEGCDGYLKVRLPFLPFPLLARRYTLFLCLGLRS